jgi:serine palmitoyltransferase
MRCSRRACRLRGQGLVDVKPRIHPVVTAVLARKDCERAAVVIKAAVTNALARRHE